MTPQKSKLRSFNITHNFYSISIWDIIRRENRTRREEQCLQMSVNSKFKKYLLSQPTGVHANLAKRVSTYLSWLILHHWSNLTSAIYFVNGCETQDWEFSFGVLTFSFCFCLFIFLSEQQKKKKVQPYIHDIAKLNVLTMREELQASYNN